MRNAQNPSIAIVTARSIAVAVAISMISGGVAVAKVHRKYARPHTYQYFRLYQGPSTNLPSVEVRGHSNFDRSGTLGREGLGASPFHAEGPGNFSD